MAVFRWASFCRRSPNLWSFPCGSSDHIAIKGKNLEHEEDVRNVCAGHSDPPTLFEKKEAHEVRTK